MEANVDRRVPVLIVGGSLVGLSTSLFLGRHGVRHLLVEKHSGTSTHPRGRGNNVRTMEVFRSARVEPAIREAASILAENHGILQAGSLTGEDDQKWLFKEIDPGGALARFSPTGWCLCSQNDVEPVLLARAREQAGADVRFSTEMISFSQDATGVTAVLKDRETGEQSTVRAQYLVAADGPRSPIREQLRIGQSGNGDLFHNVSITFRSRGLSDVLGERRFIVCYLTNPEADGALLPVDNREAWVFHAPWHPEHGETLEHFTDERCADHIRKAVGEPGLDVEITGKAPWHAAERVADRYSFGRVFLAGDSAHEMSPTGAFGSNTGIQDAHNLAWKLAAVLSGAAEPGLLDTYEQERRPVAQATSERASARSAEHSHPGYSPAVTPGGGRQGGMLTVAMGYSYPQGAVVGADPDRPVVPERMRLTGEPGTRAPHMWVTGPEGHTSLLDLYERSFVLLSSVGTPWRAAGRKIAERLSVRLEAYAIGIGPDADLVPGGAGEAAGARPRTGATAMGGGPKTTTQTAPETEAAADWAVLHGTTPEGAVLVRPDGFVAWRSQDAVPDPAATLEKVMTHLLHRA